MSNPSDIRDVIYSREGTYSKALSRFFELAKNGKDRGHYEAIREATELVSCLRRLVKECSVDEICRAFGSPGDFGYETEIGKALAALYRGESK